MDYQEAEKLAAELTEQIRYHNKKYYDEDAPEIDDSEYDALYRRLENLEAEFPQLVTPDSPTQSVGGHVLAKFSPVTHTVPMESLHDSFLGAGTGRFRPARPRCGAGPCLYCGTEVRRPFRFGRVP